MAELLLSLMLGALVGVSLGMLGAGGSILAVPALILFVGLTPHEATSTSLIVVGITAAAAALGHRRRGTIDVRVALRFAAAGVIGSLMGSFASAGTSERALALAFAGVMVVAAAAMWPRTRDGATATADQPHKAPTHPLRRTITAGMVVGLLTGFFGIGGGFLAVPALTYALGMDITTAIGTSLVVIAINAAVALAPRLAGGTIEVSITAYFVVGGLLGGFLGTRWAHTIAPRRLKQIFACVVFVTAVALFSNSITT